MPPDREDTWAAGKLYEPYVGRWSRLVARDFLQWLELPAQLDWLGVGCGTGALTEVILQEARPRSVTGMDAVAPCGNGFVRPCQSPATARFRSSPGRGPYADVHCRETLQPNHAFDADGRQAARGLTAR